MDLQRTRDIATAFMHSSDGLILSDSEGRILMLNPAFRRVTGIRQKSVLGCNCSELVQSGILSDSGIVRAIETRTTATVRVRTPAKREVVSTARPILDENRELIRVVCNVRNLTVVHEADHREPGPDFVALREELGVVAKSPKMLGTLEIATELARLDCNVLILGETGVGKDLIARYIYRESDRAQTGSFVKVNCAAIPASLFESELFGYERGAFTGALDAGKSGLVEMADRGVLFLDEIGDLPLELQGKLLSLIEDHQIIRVGGISTRKVDVRILAATNRDLAQLVSQGRFREDLYYRIAVIPLHVPALRERREDIKELLIHFQEILSKKHGRKRVLGQQLCEFLTHYSWPGNVRELANLVECLFVTGRNEVLDVSDLAGSFFFSGLQPRIEKSSLSFAVPKSLKELLAKYELEVVRQAIANTSSYAEAARLLKTSLSTINRHARRLENRGEFVGELSVALGVISTITTALS
jgi:PAS domain S-box-containing protein